MQTQLEENSAIVSEINIIPFVDIVLVVLIVFLIISPTFINPGFDINLPKAETDETPKNIKALLSIDMEGEVYFNRTRFNRKKLVQKLKELVRQNIDIKVVIAADKNVAHGNVIALIDLARKAGVKKFAVSIESAH